MKALPLLFLIAAGPLMGAEPVAALDAEIHKLENRLKDIQQLVEKGLPEFVCGQEWVMMRGFKEKLQVARKSGDLKTAAQLEEILKIYEQQLAEALKPKPLKVEGLAEDIERLKQELVHLRAKRDELAQKAKASAAKPEGRIAELESKLASLIELIRPVCHDDVPILQKKLAQVNKDIEQARKGESKNAIARLEGERDQIAKALDDLSPRGGKSKIEDVVEQMAQVKGELTRLKVERLKEEIERREQGVENIVRVMRTHFLCGNDVVDAEENLLEARKKLAAANQAGDNDAAKSAEETIRKVNARFDELKKPVIDGVTIETISEDITRLKKEKFELEAELEILESPPKTKEP